MSKDLTVAASLNNNPQQVADQDGNKSGLFLTDDTTGTTHLRPTGKLVFGLDGANGGGFGEWIQNSVTQQSIGDFGISFFANSKEGMRLTNTGLVGIGTKTPSAMLHVNGDMEVNGRVQFTNLPLGLSNFRELVVNDVGLICTIRLGTSERFTENISEFKDDFSKILSLNPVSFQSRETGETGFGYLAEELQEKDLQNLVSYDAEGKPFSVHYKLMPIYLLEVLKEQQKTIRRLQSEVTELKAVIE